MFELCYRLCCHVLHCVWAEASVILIIAFWLCQGQVTLAVEVFIIFCWLPVYGEYNEYCTLLCVTDNWQ